jgi:hypothetical protein
MFEEISDAKFEIQMRTLVHAKAQQGHSRLATQEQILTDRMDAACKLAFTFRS